MITPNDIDNLQFKKTALGYSVEEVDDFLDKLIVDYEKVFKDNVKLNSRVNTLEENIKRYDNMEESIKTSIMLAEKTAKEAKVNAEEQADNIIERARIEAEKLIERTYDQKNAIENEIFALKKSYQMLKAKLKMLLEAELNMLVLGEEEFDKHEDVDIAPANTYAASEDDEYDDEYDEEYDDDVDFEESEEEPLTVPNAKSDKKAEQEKKLKVLAELFDEGDK